MIKEKLYELKSLKNQLLITGVKIKLMVPNYTRSNSPKIELVSLCAFDIV